MSSAYKGIKVPGSNTLRMMIDTEDPLFSGMKKLKIQGRDLTSVPPELFNITELEVLDISPEREASLHYKLHEIPTAIGKLQNLRVLMVDTNDLTRVPPELGQLANLERLALSNNLLTELPDAFADLQNLKSLHLANNKFTKISAPILSLTKLQFLDMSDNMIQKIPKAISRLTQLETLLIFSNQLRGLPNEICDLVQLRCIWIGYNKIQNLPKNFGRLKLLDWSWHYTSTILNENPLIHPPIEVCKQGADEIEKYFAMIGNSADRMMYTQEDDEDTQFVVYDDRDASSPLPPTPQARPSASPAAPGGNTLDINPSAMRLLRRGSTSDPSFLHQLQT